MWTAMFWPLLLRSLIPAECKGVFSELAVPLADLAANDIDIDGTSSELSLVSISGEDSLAFGRLRSIADIDPGIAFSFIPSKH